MKGRAGRLPGAGESERIQWWAFWVAGAMEGPRGRALVCRVGAGDVGPSQWMGGGGGHEFLIPGAVNLGTHTH